MGSGSGGGGGSGGGTGGSGGGTGGGGGGPTWRRRRIPRRTEQGGGVDRPPELEPGVVEKPPPIEEIIRRIPTVYVKRQFSNSLVRTMYREVCAFPSWTGGDACARLSAEYGVDPGRGFLVRWVDGLMDRYSADEPNAKMRATARMAAEDFLIGALNEDLDLYVFGSCNEVLPRMDQPIFREGSRSFLGYLILRVLEREFERQPQAVQDQLRDESRQLASEIVAEYEERVKVQASAGSCGFFEFVEENVDWFVDRLRREKK